MCYQIARFLGTICLTWLFTTGSKPIEFVKSLFNVSENSDPKDNFRKIIQILINCDLCSGFWIGVIVYRDIFIAAIVSILSESLGRVLSKLWGI